MPRYSAATPRILGAAAVAQNLLTIENQTGSGKIIQIRRLVMQMDATAVLTSFMPIIRTNRTSGMPSGGTALAKVRYDLNDAISNANIIVRGGASADGTNSTITATPGTDLLWQQYGMRLHTAVGQVLGLDNNQLPLIVENTPVVIRENQALVVHIVAAATSSNPNTNHYFVQIAWDEV